ncbi:MAG: hypothetical protein U9R37_01120 [Campylobacterota bacterium]|nr:hypothetical protein [Campylobacterota bacterium]
MKRIKNYIFISSLAILFTSCSQSATSVFEKDPIYAQNIQYTKIGKIIKNKDVKAMINVTYLNSVDSGKWDNDEQNFIIGFYKEEGNYEDYILTMNDQNVTDTKDISKNDKIYKNIPFKNNWAKYQIVTFDDTKDKRLTLKYTNPTQGTTNVVFQKE